MTRVAAADDFVVLGPAKEAGHEGGVHLALEGLGGAEDEEGEHAGGHAREIAGDGRHGALLGEVGGDLVEACEDLSLVGETGGDVGIFKNTVFGVSRWVLRPSGLDRRQWESLWCASLEKMEGERQKRGAMSFIPERQEGDRKANDKPVVECWIPGL